MKRVYLMFLVYCFSLHAMDKQVVNEDVSWVPLEETRSRNVSQHTPQTTLLDQKGRFLSMVPFMTALKFAAEKDGLNIPMLEKSFEQIPSEKINTLIEKYPHIFGSFMQAEKKDIQKASDGEIKKVREFVFQEAIDASNQRESMLHKSIMENIQEITQLGQSNNWYKRLSFVSTGTLLLATAWAVTATYFAMAR